MPKIPRQVMDLTGQTYGQLLVLAYGRCDVMGY
jgi:hypothetical protein